MKNYLLLSLCIIAFSCKKSNNNPPATPTNPTTNIWKHFVPNWRYDTIVSYDNNLPPKHSDTLITNSVNDTSYVIYKGKQYYIWTEAISQYDTFKTDLQVYANCIISPTLKTSDNIAPNLQVIAQPYKYKSYNHYDSTKQSLEIGNKINFDTLVTGIYISIK